MMVIFKSARDKLRLLAIFLFLLSRIALFGCDEPPESDDIIYPITDPQGVLPPAPDNETTIDGSTLFITGFKTVPVVHSYPKYAGVSEEGELGIGSALGYDPGDTITLPINANLGGKNLKFYKFQITISHPEKLSLLEVLGNDTTLATRFPAQYNPAGGFSSPPSIIPCGAGCIQISASTSSSYATGRVNLARIKFQIREALPPQGIELSFQVVELKDDSDADLCAQFTDGCLPNDGIIIENFWIIIPP